MQSTLLVKSQSSWITLRRHLSTPQLIVFMHMGKLVNESRPPLCRQCTLLIKYDQLDEIGRLDIAWPLRTFRFCMGLHAAHATVHDPA